MTSETDLSLLSLTFTKNIVLSWVHLSRLVFFFVSLQYYAWMSYIRPGTPQYQGLILFFCCDIFDLFPHFRASVTPF